MESKAPRITDPRFLFVSKDEFADSTDARFYIDLNYKYLRAADLVGLLLEPSGLQTFNIAHALDVIEDNLDAVNGAFVTISKFSFDDVVKANDVIGIIQIVSYVIFRAGGKIRFYLEIETSSP